jgi:hypothetical protein
VEIEEIVEDEEQGWKMGGLAGSVTCELREMAATSE